jgi:hypothetical protein
MTSSSTLLNDSYGRVKYQVTHILAPTLRDALVGGASDGHIQGNLHAIFRQGTAEYSNVHPWYHVIQVRPRIGE